MLHQRFVGSVVALLLLVGAAWGVPPLEALQQAQPYAPNHTWPVLTAAQWTGDPDLDAVILLSIDDMRDPAKYEAFLRPILDKLAEVGAPGALSIFTNSVDPNDPQLQAWLKEGLSLEAHTIKHPCPMLCQGNLDEAKKTYDECVDLLDAVPGNRPVASRVPCCDSMDSASPRYFSEIIAGITPAGAYLPIDSSVFNFFNPDDPGIPDEIVADAERAPRGRFEKYIPFAAYTTTISNYPYPYIVGNHTWEFPCTAPSDWEAQNRNQPFAPQSIEDMKAAIDATVVKQGTYVLCFHPHHWIKPEQVADLIEHAHSTYGPRVRFMNFHTAADLLQEHLLLGVTLRKVDGWDNGARLADVNNDGYMDVLLGNAQVQTTRVWQPEHRAWETIPMPVRWTEAAGPTAPLLAHFDGGTVLIQAGGSPRAWRFGDGWQDDKGLVQGLSTQGTLRAVDLNGDEQDELLDDNGAVFVRDTETATWHDAGYHLPDGVRFRDGKGRDAGLRWVDVDEDRDLDLVFSNETQYGLWLYDGATKGWTTEVFNAKRGDASAAREIPSIVVDGTDNGFWVAKRNLWWHNENTDTLPDRVDRRSFQQLLASVKPRAKDVVEATASMRSPGRDVVAVAAEPLVRDPVCIAWDARGRLWTVEMRDYPLGLDNNGKPGSEVRVLDDDNADGIYDRATVFLEELPWATSVMPWRDGVLVCSAPEIFFAADRDGDGKADFREVLFSGFGEGNQQHRINGLRWGVDAWIYAANGDSGGRVHSTKTGKDINVRGRDVRLNPDTGELETLTGETQFGRARDDFGRAFGCANWSPMWFYTLAERYQLRNPFLAAPDGRDFFIESNRVFPVSVVTERFNDFHMEGLFTSACGLEIYRDGLLTGDIGAALDLFTCEPVHNLVSRRRGEYVEGGFVGARIEEENNSEFLASTDPWFRPVMTRTGPNGALFVADMYRQVIEHPEYINIEKQQELDFRAGEDEGRVWRVTPHGVAPGAIPNLTELGSAELVALLATPNGTLRDLVQQRLYEQNDPEANALLQSLANDTEASAAARVAALWLLERRAKLNADTVARALGDSADGLVLNAMQLAESRLDNPAVQAALLAAAKHALEDAPALRVQAAYTLGEWDDPRAWEALSGFFGGGRVLRVAALSSVNEHNIATLAGPLLALAQQPDDDAFDGDAHAQVFMVMAGCLLKREENQEALEAFARAVFVSADGAAPALWQWRGARELADTIKRFGHDLADVLARWPEVYLAAEALLDRARDTVADTGAAEEVRALAAHLLGREKARLTDDAAALARVVEPRNPPALIEAALGGLQKMGTPAVATHLITGWPGYSPALQTQVAEVIFSRAEWTHALVQALEEGTLSARQLGLAQRQRLQAQGDDVLRARIAKAFGVEASPDRQAVIDRLRPALRLQGDRDHGKVIFTERCAVCHLIDGVGNRVGADLESMTDRRPEAIITSLLDPNRAVETRYVAYEVETADLSTFSGIMSAESATSITLTGANGLAQTVLRSEVSSIRSTDRSIMPEGLEEGLSEQDIADLLAFVAGAEPPPKSLAGNTPAEVVAEADGRFALTAENAELRGPTLTYEPQMHNIGFWASPLDRATWRLRGLRAGEYQVELEYCCDSSVAGNGYRLAIGDNVILGRVAGTGTWNNYEEASIGTVKLSGEETMLNLSAEGDIRGYLADVRRVTLVPVETKGTP